MGYNIIGLEDSEMIRMRLSVQSMKRGHKYKGFASWMEFVREVKENGDYDVLLLDVELPAFNGARFIPVLRKSIPNISKIVLYSSTPYQKLKRLAEKFGADGCISKNFSEGDAQEEHLFSELERILQS